MNSHYTYLLLNLLSVIFPLLLSFDKKVAFYKSWKYLFPAILISATFFIIWDIVFTAQGVWSFNPKYVLGINVFNLPIEEILFFICVPYACIFIYEVLNVYVKRSIFGCGQRTSIVLCVILLVLCIGYYDRLYTLVNAGICLLLLAFAAFVYKFENLGRFNLAYLVSLIPFLICNGILTALPVVIYNNNENCGFRIYTIPVEDLFYCMSMLLAPILLMDYFKNRKTALN